jgi:hypothetical protein
VGGRLVNIKNRRGNLVISKHMGGRLVNIKVIGGRIVISKDMGGILDICRILKYLMREHSRYQY